VFINIIKSVSIIDPTGVSLKYISEDIKNYLREKRSDTVKCIVREMIDKDGQSELYKELEASDKNKNLDYDSDDNDEWNPSPKYADPSCKCTKVFICYESNTTPIATSKDKIPYPDIVRIFVNMFRGNKEIFISEYRAILSDGLLVKQNFDTNQEAHILELLKIRFGEKNLQTCDIMIKDVSDSKFMCKNFQDISGSQVHNAVGEYCIECNIHSLTHTIDKFPNIQVEEATESECITPILLSQSAWPALLDADAKTPDIEIKLHPVITNLLEQYSAHYKSLKAPRHLIWYKSIGNISFSVEIGSRSVDVDTNPITASVLLYFCDKNVWTSDELSKVLNLDKEDTEKRVTYWLLRGFLRKSSVNTEALELVDELDDRQMFDTHHLDNDNEEESNEQADALSIYEPIIMNMLQSMEVMALDRIHNMLSLFVHDPFPAYDKTMQELGVYLGSLVQEGKLQLDGGLYRVKQ
jgi:anaphase-promoting complex subunit 2